MLHWLQEVLLRVLGGGFLGWLLNSFWYHLRKGWKGKGEGEGGERRRGRRRRWEYKALIMSSCLESEEVPATHSVLLSKLLQHSSVN